MVWSLSYRQLHSVIFSWPEIYACNRLTPNRPCPTCSIHYRSTFALWRSIGEPGKTRSGGSRLGTKKRRTRVMCALGSSGFRSAVLRPHALTAFISFQYRGCGYEWEYIRMRCRGQEEQKGLSDLGYARQYVDNQATSGPEGSRTYERCALIKAYHGAVDPSSPGLIGLVAREQSGSRRCGATCFGLWISCYYPMWKDGGLCEGSITDLRLTNLDTQERAHNGITGTFQLA
jgi:hypothetical protein